MASLETVKEAAKLLTKATQLLSNGPLEYYLTELAGANEYLMNRFCPFKPGDRAMLTKAPALSKNSGWKPWEYLMKPGAYVIVHSVECRSTGICVNVKFVEDPDEDGGIFAFSDSYLVKPYVSPND